MPPVPSKVATRIVASLKRFQPILAAAKSRDVNESDTVVIVADMLQDVFGYDKYTEITSEHAIRGTFCDLAVKVDGALMALLETKAIGLDLKDNHVKQAVDYAANQGVDWVILTNGIVWRVYKVTFSKPIDNELVVEFNVLDLNPKQESHVELLWLLTKESWQKAALGEHHAQKQALSRFTLGALILSDTVLDVLRRELRRVTPGIRIEAEEIKNALLLDVLKRDVVEGDKADAARKLVSRASARPLRAGKSESAPTGGADPESVATAEPEPVAAVAEATASDAQASEQPAAS